MLPKGENKIFRFDFEFYGTAATTGGVERALS